MSMSHVATKGHGDDQWHLSFHLWQGWCPRSVLLVTRDQHTGVCHTDLSDIPIQDHGIIWTELWLGPSLGLCI